jgi:hypothetical protein
MFAKTFALASLASMASAHILMTNPVPYGASSLSNSPLDASGSDFPCKQRTGVYELEGASNSYAQGSTQQLEFKGTAVHGGGSCQVVVSQDLEPNKGSTWKVIKSIEGGCPAKDASGNLGDSADAAVPYKYDFTIPKDMAAGEYTLAWTWFNKVGNREMYMNCAPLTVTGSKGDASFFDSLPDMFVANIENGCKVPDSKDVLFPNPGDDVEKLNGATQAFATPEGQCGPTGGTPSPTDAPEQPDPAPEPTTAPQEPAPVPTTPPQEPAPAPTNPGGGVFISVTIPATAPEVPAPTSAPEQPEEPAPEQPEQPPAAGGYEVGSACTDEGAWNCIEGGSFQRCASGTWSATMPLSAGVTCNAGKSTDLAMAAAPIKRFMRRALRIKA